MLHDLCGRPMLWYVLEALRATGIEEIVVVANEELAPQLDAVRRRVRRARRRSAAPDTPCRSRWRRSNRATERVVVAYGDMPLVDATIFEDVQAPSTPMPVRRSGS